VTANLTPQYREAEARFRAAKGHDEKLSGLREMIALLPKHKGTEKMLADLRARVARLEEESRRSSHGGHRYEPGHVPREGAGQWVLVGPPNAGKSALLRALTHAHPEVADYPFTTQVPLPGMMLFEDVAVQLVDTPPVATGNTEPYMTGLAHAADGVLLVVDVSADDLAASAKLLGDLLDHAQVWPRHRSLPKDASPSLALRPVRVLGNKCDLDDGTYCSLAAEAIGRDYPFHPTSALRGDGLDALRPVLFHELRRIRVYTKEPGHPPDRSLPFVLPEGATVQDLALRVHKEVAEALRFARIWGKARFEGQQVDRHHVLSDRDVVELHS
jgi:ribosome-interacting GTPase 1